MKRGIFYLFAVCAALCATSCEQRKQDWDLPSAYVYVTVKDAATKADDGVYDGAIYFEMDDETTLYVGENKWEEDYNTLAVGSRALVGVSVSKSQTAEYDYMAKLYNVIDVIVGENETVTSESESDAIADDKLTFFSTDVSLTHGYLNVYTYYQTDNPAGAKLYLVDNTMEASEEPFEDYLYLELRYDSASTGGDKSTQYSYVSFDMESLEARMDGMKGIALRVKTEKSATFNLIIPAEDLYPKED